jgi:hypothetical protein
MNAIRALTIFSLFIPLTQAYSQTASPPYFAFMTGNHLYLYCTGNMPAQYDTCVGYVMGVVDVSNSLRTSGGHSSCPSNPQGIMAMQIKDVVIRYLSNHPEQRDWPAAGLVGYSVQEAWGCR